jgi:uroporphyrinogen-III synthase
VSHLPLAGKRILVTRAPDQASELADQLRALGATPILIPTIEIAPPTSFCALDAALASLRAYDLVVFTSANAVRAFQQRAAHIGIMPSPRSIAVVGPATARAVEAIGLTVDIIPPVYTAESLAEALTPTAAGRHILLIRPEAPPPPEPKRSGAPSIEAPPDGWDVEPPPDPLSAILTAAGATITATPAYGNRIPATSIAALRDLFSDPTHYPDAITFTSASTATNLLTLLESAGLTLPASILRASIGPVTSAALTELKFPPHIEAAEATIPSLVAALFMRL